MYAPLLTENRSGTFDLIRYGYICIVDEHSRVLYQAGDPEDFVFYRSASKPIQSLPVFKYGLDRKYGLTDEESAILSGSHAGMPVHVAAVENILRKAGFDEDILCMNPAAPGDEASNERRLRAGLPKRKVYHNCSGKHCALLMVQRELGGRAGGLLEGGHPGPPGGGGHHQGRQRGRGGEDRRGRLRRAGLCGARALHRGGIQESCMY